MFGLYASVLNHNQVVHMFLHILSIFYLMDHRWFPFVVFVVVVLACEHLGLTRCPYINQLG